MVGWIIFCICIVGMIGAAHGGLGSAIAAILIVGVLISLGYFMLNPLINTISKRIEKTLDFVENKLGKI